MKQNIDSNYNFLLVGAASHVGQVRKANEDSMAAFEAANMKVFVVCDGMGGHVGGKVASQTAITAIHDFLLNNIMLDPREAIYNSMIVANEAILNRARQQPELEGMGSTCVMLVVTSDGKVYYGHVGDSRIYIIANHRIKQLTEDHSVVWEMFKAGMIKTREEMERHPRKNEITNALGLPNMQPPTLCNAPIEPDSGNCFLLCSDGLTGMVSDEPIQRVISKHEIPIQQRAETLVKMANEKGGVDNITVQLVEFAVGTQQINTGRGKKAKNWAKRLCYVLLALVALGGLTWFILTKVLPPKPDRNPVEIEEQNPLPVYFTEPVEFEAGKEVTKKILQFPDSLTIEASSVKTVSNVSIKEIDKNYITIRWRLKPPVDTIVVSCKTTEKQSCTIKIPLVKTLGQNGIDFPTGNKDNVSSEKDIKMDTIAFGFNEARAILVKIPVKQEIQWLTRGEKTTNHPESVKCEVVIDTIIIEKKQTIRKKMIVIEFRKSDYPDEEVIFYENRPPFGTYKFIIPVKKPLKATEESLEQQPTEDNKQQDTSKLVV